jgi:prolipoprotein diacylglyceryltransferase
MSAQRRAAAAGFRGASVTELPGHQQGWGVLPVLVHLGPLPIYAYETFLLLALGAGFALLWWNGRDLTRRRELSTVTFAALVGGAFGAKLLDWAINANLVAKLGFGTALLSGRTVIGGFLGGTVAVAIAKRRAGIKIRLGNQIAAPIALGLCIGRIGCFLHGCCYGTPTSLPWGVDFGVRRHPTQLYEAAFAFMALVVLLFARRRTVAAGRLFGGFMIGYFAFRFLEEFLRAGPRPLLGFTPYQVASVVGLLYFVTRELKSTVDVRGAVNGGVVPR